MLISRPKISGEFSTRERGYSTKEKECWLDVLKKKGWHAPALAILDLDQF